MADRVRSVWKPKLIILATNLPVDLDVTLLTTQGDLMRAAGQAAEAQQALAERGWWLAPERAREPEGIRRAQPNSVIILLLQFSPALAQFPAAIPTQGNLLHTTLWARLPQVAAFRLAVVVHPGLRASPPPDGVLRECLRRHGLVPAWADLSAAVPELVPDATALKSVKDAEGSQLAEVREGLRTAAYRVAGRRGRSGTVAWDPARVADPAAVLSALLGESVTVDWRSPDPEPATSPASAEETDIMDPQTWAPPARRVIVDEGEPPPMWHPARLPKAPSPYVIAGLFRTGERLILDVTRRSPPPPSAQGAAA
jgi:hypothetical protein